jgi:hypothetical protein
MGYAKRAARALFFERTADYAPQKRLFLHYSRNAAGSV